MSTLNDKLAQLNAATERFAEHGRKLEKTAPKDVQAAYEKHRRLADDVLQAHAAYLSAVIDSGQQALLQADHDLEKMANPTGDSLLDAIWNTSPLTKGES